MESGRTILGPGESIFPSFVRPGVSIAAGCDDWCGNYLLASDKSGDRVLLDLVAHLAAVDPSITNCCGHDRPSVASVSGPRRHVRHQGISMRITGTLIRWHDERGFGFIAPAEGGAEVFVHASAFPRSGGRPEVGESLGYELATGRNGKLQAVAIVRLSHGPPRPATKRPAASSRATPNVFGSLVLLAVVGAAGVWAYEQIAASLNRKSLAAQPAAKPGALVPAQISGGFRCDGRTQCSQMSSCAEATWFINNCPGTRMDGNSDGIPCEQQWCTSSFSR